MLTSEVYNSRQSALKGINSVKTNSQRLKAFDMRISKNEKDYFVLKAKNGRIIGVSEMYKSNQMMRKGIKSVMKNAPDAPIFELTKEGYDEIK